ncbi:MAG: S-methylmethionine-dependent homocysteine/selenocysteine methylase [Oceanicoccus sp.]|jgi:S-methylmethionine-dependent homocysteine/selenocysteine methylase
MSDYRNRLPQLSGDIYLTDAGLETDLIFNRGIAIREFAAHTLLSEKRGRDALASYFRDFLSLANRHDAGFILDTPTWKAHSHWAGDLGATDCELRDANTEAVEFVSTIRQEFSVNNKPIVINGVIGPKGDAYAPADRISVQEAENYHAKQLAWLVGTEIDMLTGMTFTQSDEAVGIVRAAQNVGLPIVISFTVETNGCLPTGQSLGAAIQSVDRQTGSGAAYYMVNCAHPDHFADQFKGHEWSRRIRGIRCNASRLSHRELDACAVLDAGDPDELAEQYKLLVTNLPWLNVFGGCCGSDLRHIAKIIKVLGTNR